jgi:hypothetical protein
VEVHDAISVMQGPADFTPRTIDALHRSLQHFGLAQGASTAAQREEGLLGVLEELDEAAEELGLNISFHIGAGTLMF